MRTNREAPGTIVTNFKPSPQLTKAWAQKGEIAFEIQVPDKAAFPVIASYLATSFFQHMPDGASETFGPIAVHEPDDNSILVIYKPHSHRKTGNDLGRILQVLSEADVPVTASVVDGMVQAFDNMKALSAPEPGSAVAALEEQQKRAQMKGRDTRRR